MWKGCRLQPDDRGFDTSLRLTWRNRIMVLQRPAKAPSLIRREGSNPSSSAKIKENYGHKNEKKGTAYWFGWDKT